MWSECHLCYCVCSSVKVLSGAKQSAGGTEMPSAAQRPLSAISATVTTTDSAAALSTPARHSMSSVISAAVTATSGGSVPVTSGITSATSASVSTGVDSVPTSLQRSSTAVSTSTADTATDVDSTEDVAATSSTVQPSSLVAQLSYAQPSIEQLLRRRAKDTTTNGDTSTVTTTTTQGPAHLLSSRTQAALAALANTPRR